MASSGANMIRVEMDRQIYQEGYTREHDAEHSGEELLTAAICYAQPKILKSWDTPDSWPWDVNLWKPTEQITDLVKAGALIAAEIDRLLRERNHGHQK